MQYFAVLAAILSVAAADTPVTGNWQLFCGSSCDSATQVASGTLTSGDTCAAFGSTFAYCRFEGTDFFRASLYADSGCSATGYAVISPGQCTSAGNWQSHTISALL